MQLGKFNISNTSYRPPREPGIPDVEMNVLRLVLCDPPSVHNIQNPAFVELGMHRSWYRAELIPVCREPGVITRYLNCPWLNDGCSQGSDGPLEDGLPLLSISVYHSPQNER